MKIETQALEQRQTKIIAELDSEVFDQYMRRAARKIAGKARIPGFRPGKAPYDVVRRMYGDQTLHQEAIEIMLDEVYPQILKEANVSASGPGKLDEIISIQPPRFSFVVPLEPEVQIGDYRSVRKEYAPITISDEDVENTLNRMRRSYGTAEPVERPAEAGDLVSIKLSIKRVNPEEGQPAMILDSSSYQMTAGESEEDGKWPYENFTQELLGMSAGENKTWTHTFSQDTEYEDLRGKEAEFTLEIESVKSLALPELNDEFAQSLGQFENMDVVRSAIRTQMERGSQQEYDSSYLNDVISQIVDQSTVEYPPHMLEKEIEDFLHGMEHDLEHEHLDLDTYLKMREMDRETFIDVDVKPAAIRRLQRSLILNELARLESVQLNDQEIRSIYQMAMQQMQSPEMKKAQAKNKRSAQEMAESLAISTMNSIFNQRLMARIKAIANGEGDKVDQPIVIDETTALDSTAIASDGPADVETSEAAQEIEPVPAESAAETPEAIASEATESDASESEAQESSAPQDSSNSESRPG